MVNSTAAVARAGVALDRRVVPCTPSTVLYAPGSRRKSARVEPARQRHACAASPLLGLLDRWPAPLGAGKGGLAGGAADRFDSESWFEAPLKESLKPRIPSPSDLPISGQSLGPEHQQQHSRSSRMWTGVI